MTIITQDEELINYNSIKRIAAFIGDVEGKDEKVYAVLAFDTNSSIDDEITDGVMQLGIYNNEYECNSVMQMLIEQLEKNAPVFRMPQTI